MANKRQLKKFIENSCGAVAAEMILSAAAFPEIDRKAVGEVVNDAMALQAQSLSRINVSFDKSQRDFDNRAQYNKARHEYYAAAYRALLNDFDEQLITIVTKMNAAMPESVRQEFKKAITE